MNWCELNGVERKFIAPYRHQSVGLAERHHQTLINRIRKLKLLAGSSWMDYSEKVVQLINKPTHILTKYSPLELWNRTQEDRIRGHQRMTKECDYRNKRRRFYRAKFYLGQVVLAWNEQPGLLCFQPKWRGPFVLIEQISSSIGAARPHRKKRRGRQPVLHFHVDQMQPFSAD